MQNREGSPKSTTAKRSGDVIVFGLRLSQVRAADRELSIFETDGGTKRAPRPEFIMGTFSNIVPGLVKTDHLEIDRSLWRRTLQKAPTFTMLGRGAHPLITRGMEYWTISHPTSWNGC